MEPETIRALAVLLGVDPMKLSASLDSLDKEEDEDQGGGTLDNFYFNPNVFMKLHSIDYKGLRALVVPNLKRLRR